MLDRQMLDRQSRHFVNAKLENLPKHMVELWDRASSIRQSAIETLEHFFDGPPLEFRSMQEKSIDELVGVIDVTAAAIFEQGQEAHSEKQIDSSTSDKPNTRPNRIQKSTGGKPKGNKGGRTGGKPIDKRRNTQQRGTGETRRNEKRQTINSRAKTLFDRL
jgi:hypothetical protein